MDDCIQTGVTSNVATLPGRLGLRRRAPILYRRLMRGFYPAMASPLANLARIGVDTDTTSGAIAPPLEETLDENNHSSVPSGVGPRTANPRSLSAKRAARVTGAFDHPLLPEPPVRAIFQPFLNIISPYISGKPLSQRWIFFLVMPSQ